MDVVLSRRTPAFGFAGQTKMKTCAPLRVRGGPQTTSMRLDNRAADWESHTGTVSFRGEERAEDLFGLQRRQSDAGIANRDQQLAILDWLRAYRKFTIGAYVLHGVDAIEHQVHEYLLQLDAVCHDLGKILGDVAADRNRVPGGLVAQQDNHFTNDFIHINQLPLQSALLEQQADSANDLGRARYVCHDP